MNTAPVVVTCEVVGTLNHYKIIKKLVLVQELELELSISAFICAFQSWCNELSSQSHLMQYAEKVSKERGINVKGVIYWVTPMSGP